MKIYDKEIEKHSTALTAAMLIIITFLIGFYTGYAISETESTEVVQNESRNNVDTKWQSKESSHARN